MSHLKQYNSNRSKQLNGRELKFCEAYIENDGKIQEAGIVAGYAQSSAAVSGNLILNRPHVKKFLKSKMKSAEDKIGTSYLWKLKKLKHIADVCAPDNAESPEDFKYANLAINSICEMNKMEGDLAPTKTFNANLNVESDKEQLDLLIEECKKEY